LAVPYAFSRLDADAQAADYYVTAINAFTAEIARIDEAVESVRNGELLSDWLAAQESEAVGWYYELDRIPESTESRYLVELMASNQFQEGVKNYHDLLSMSENLTEWVESLRVFDDILDTRQRAYEARMPAIDASLNDIRLDELERHRVELESRLRTIEQTEDVVALGTPDQQRIWNELDAMETNLKLIAGQPNAADLAEKQRFFKGLLLWDLNRDYRARLWNEQRSLRELERELREARERHHAVSTASSDWPKEFAELTSRIAGLRPRLDALNASMLAAVSDQREYLELVAIDSLESQRDRLNTYMVQARFSLATIYDRAADAAPETTAALIEGPQ
jgi:hypothetical protein